MMKHAIQIITKRLWVDLFKPLIAYLIISVLFLVLLAIVTLPTWLWKIEEINREIRIVIISVFFSILFMVAVVSLVSCIKGLVNWLKQLVIEIKENE